MTEKKKAPAKKAPAKKAPVKKKAPAKKAAPKPELKAMTGAVAPTTTTSNPGHEKITLTIKSLAPAPIPERAVIKQGFFKKLFRR